MKLFLLLTLFVSQVFAASKLYEITKSVNCEENIPILTHFVVNNGTTVPNKVDFGGYFEVTEKVLGPFELSIDANRCDHSLKKCEKYVAGKNSGMCEIFNGKSGLFTDVLKTFEPQIKCPWMPGKYVAKNSAFDLSSISVLPSEGYTWVVTIKGLAGDGKNKKLVMCMYVEAKISKFRKKNSVK
ncbi:unnamed protein product [Chironomus riparius]|uniref:MD-2-related lipid-recognition domain-containing protein n=1 Tax=Chironomus riparius TaxID=315576 RepID=A0A9N9RNW1_9DIPT|nr:unnamed protein product [Chironomus riparius]